MYFFPLPFSPLMHSPPPAITTLVHVHESFRLFSHSLLPLTSPPPLHQSKEQTEQGNWGQTPNIVFVDRDTWKQHYSTEYSVPSTIIAVFGSMDSKFKNLFYT